MTASAPLPALFIFDFDGVVADSELLANTGLAEALCAIGLPTTLEDSLQRYMGRRWADNRERIAEALGRTATEEELASCQAGVRTALAGELAEVRGLSAFLDRFDAVPRCIASSSGGTWIAGALGRLGLAERFGDRLFSAQRVARGKPAPDLFLLAAAEMGVSPADALVIEDSAPGVEGARAAGMRVVGLCAGSHIRPGHADRLAAAGAHRVVESYAELAAMLGG